MSNRIWKNEEGTVLVELWESGTLTVATRDTTSHTWGPPVNCAEEKRPESVKQEGK